MKDQSVKNPIGYVVVCKRDGVIIEFKRNTKKQTQIYAHAQPAINAVKKLRAGYQDAGEWVAMTTIRLAEIHRKEWESARV